MSIRSNLTKWMMGGVLAAGLWTIGVASPVAAAQRDYREACRARLESARARLDADAARFGPRDRRVVRDRGRLEDARRWCRGRHSDWDHGRYDRD